MVILLKIRKSEDAETSDGSQESESQEQPALVWTPANMERPRVFPFTGNSGIQVRTVGFEAFDYFSLFVNEDLINSVVTETNRLR